MEGTRCTGSVRGRTAEEMKPVCSYNIDKTKDEYMQEALLLLLL